MNALLLSDKDISDCLTNCSNQGNCVVNSNADFVCECLEGFSGRICNTDQRPCSAYPCINEGKCINIKNGTSYSFVCDCPYPFFGGRCQNKIDICKNVTCSGNGYCLGNLTEPVCVCADQYSGTNCENMSSKLKVIKQVISVASVLAAMILVIFFMSFIVIDVANQFFIAAI